MLKIKSIIELAKGEKQYCFQCDTDSSLADVYEILSQMRSYIYGRIKEQQDEQKPPEEPKSE